MLVLYPTQKDDEGKERALDSLSRMMVAAEHRYNQ